MVWKSETRHLPSRRVSTFILNLWEIVGISWELLQCSRQIETKLRAASIQFVNLKLTQSMNSSSGEVWDTFLSTQEHLFSCIGHWFYPWWFTNMILVQWWTKFLVQAISIASTWAGIVTAVLSAHTLLFSIATYIYGQQAANLDANCVQLSINNHFEGRSTLHPCCGCSKWAFTSWQSDSYINTHSDPPLITHTDRGNLILDYCNINLVRV